MELMRQHKGNPERLGVFPGTFNPPTRAHLALAAAALGVVDEVVFVLPRVFPHKRYEGASFEERLTMLRAAAAGEPRFSVGISEGGLFIDIARECRAHYPHPTELLFLCGRDAAERITGWDYGEAGAFHRMLDEFGMLVARRAGEYQPPEEYQGKIRTLAMTGEWDELSATHVRERIASGGPWRHLVPASIVEIVEGVYGAISGGDRGDLR